MRTSIVALLWIATISGGTAHAGKKEDQAVELYERSRRAYARGEFAKAADLIRAAQVLDPHPVLTYNLGRALEADGRTEEAIETYRHYLEMRPDAENRGFVEGRITMLTKQVEQQRSLREEVARARADEDAKRSAGARALDLSREADGHADAGRYSVAVRLYRESYAMQPDPIVLYRLAKALEGLGERTAAAESYRSFLEAAPNAPERAEVEAKLAVWSNAAAPPEEPVVLDATLSAEPVEEEGVATSAIVLTAAGGVALVAGAVLGGLAAQSHDGWSMAGSQQAAVDRLASADDMATGANVTLGLGAALVVIGGVWCLVDALSSDGESAADPEASSSVTNVYPLLRF